jgi:3-oxoadipate enol-lactonase
VKMTLNGIDVAFDDTGAGAIPLVLVHPFPFDRTLWAGQIRALADTARILAPDLRGLGETGIGPGPVTVDTYADDLAALLDARGIASAVVGGLSIGGYIAFAFYRQYPHRVRALLLVDTRAQPDSPEAKRGRDANVALVRARGSEALADKMLPLMLTARTVAARGALAQSVHATMARQPAQGIVAALGALRDRPDSTLTLAQISVPTLIIVGAEDAATPPQDAEVMRRGIHGSRLVEIAGAAHLSNVEQPEAFNRAVREFLAGLPPAQSG